MDPDLADGLGDAQAAAAARLSLVSAFTAAPGQWSSRALDSGSTLYLISGALARQVEVGGRSTVEILGPGDVIRPEQSVPGALVSGTVTWRPLAPVWFAVLDPDFWTRMGPFPSVVVSLIDRTQARARSLSMRMAMNGDPNLAARVLMLLWHLADTHGRVSRAGVILDLRLSHETIAGLVSAQRPSVSTALKGLKLAGQLRPVAGGGLLLTGRPLNHESADRSAC